MNKEGKVSQPRPQVFGIILSHKGKPTYLQILCFQEKCKKHLMISIKNFRFVDLASEKTESTVEDT